MIAENTNNVSYSKCAKLIMDKVVCEYSKTVSKDRIYQESLSIAFDVSVKLGVKTKTKDDLVQWAKRCSDFASNLTDRFCNDIKELGYSIR